MRQAILLVGPQLMWSKPGNDFLHCSIDSTQVQLCCLKQDAVPTSA